jgi:hypothetical protein
MKIVALTFVTNLVAVILAALAFYMVANDKPNYGWVIFAAIICVAYPSHNKSK